MSQIERRLKIVEERLNSLRPIKIPENLEKNINSMQKEIEFIKNSMSDLFDLKEEIGEIKELEMEIGITKRGQGKLLADEISAIKDRLRKMENLEENIFNLRRNIEEVGEILDSLKIAVNENRKKIEGLRDLRLDRLERSNHEKLEKEIKEINTALAEMAKKNRDMIDDMISSSRSANRNATMLTSELEVMRAEIRHMHTKIDRINLSPIYRRLSEIENRMRVIRAASPYVIE